MKSFSVLREFPDRKELKMQWVNGLQTALAYARVWHHYDASGQILGKLSARLALLLMGKHKPIYDPSSTYFVITGKTPKIHS